MDNPSEPLNKGGFGSEKYVEMKRKLCEWIGEKICRFLKKCVFHNYPQSNHKLST